MTTTATAVAGKTDLTKLHKSYYTSSRKPEIVFQDAAEYVSITGKGDPSGAIFQEKVQVLYSVAYAIKFIFKARGCDFSIPKLEALWWFHPKCGNPGLAEAPLRIPRSAWEYRLLLRMPDFVSEEELKTAIEIVVYRKKLFLSRETALFSMEEGSFVQMLHTGPFENEPESLSQIEDFMLRKNLHIKGMHHEIYLSDFRKTAPEKLKTILRERIE